MKAVPNKGVSRLSPGVMTKPAMNSPAKKILALLCWRRSSASAGERKRVAASAKYSRPNR